MSGLIPAHAGKTPAKLASAIEGGAHPRSRGENKGSTDNTVSDQGSSPLTRGKHLDRRPAVQADGLIPAHAGKTFSACRRANRRWAHPRSRGENQTSSSSAFLPDGSSPLTRGKPQPWPPSHPCSGLIPAHAGKTVMGVVLSVGVGAHPRSRGENCFGRRGNQANGGSSPLTRGKLRQAPILQGGRRLIPAHAGKTVLDNQEYFTAWAHPRSRGENKVEGLVGVADLGSSPLTRGKLGLGMSDSVDKGLIPAHAGKTSSRRWPPGRSRAHPRSRGENKKPEQAVKYSAGSSPLTRGKPDRFQRREKRAGLIPAHAGKTGFPSTGAFRERAHPRSRGENR